MKGKRKRLTNSQSELVATYLPKKIQKDRKIPTSVKLVLANIYQLHYLQKNWGKRTVFRTRKDFMKDIEAKDKNELNRPRDILVAENKIIYMVGSDGQATEYVLNDELYELLPTQIKGEKSSDFAKVNHLNIKQLETENQKVIVPSHNSLNDSEIQHLNVPSGTGTGTVIKNTQCIVHEIEDNFENSMNDMNIDERLVTQDEKDAWVIFEHSDGFDCTQYNDISEMVQSDAGVNNKYVENKSIYAERNEWITRLFEELDSTLNCLSQCYNKELVAGKYGYCDTLNKLFKAGDSKIDAGWFTEKQINKYNGYINRFNGLTRDRRKRFGIKDKNAESNENNIISDSTSDSVNVGGCAAPNFTEEQYQKALYEVFSKWNRWTYLSQSGYGLYDYRKKVADMLNTDINNINEGRFDMDVRGMFLK